MVSTYRSEFYHKTLSSNKDGSEVIGRYLDGLYYMIIKGEGEVEEIIPNCPFFFKEEDMVRYHTENKEKLLRWIASR